MLEVNIILLITVLLVPHDYQSLFLYVLRLVVYFFLQKLKIL